MAQSTTPPCAGSSHWTNYPDLSDLFWACQSTLHDTSPINMLLDYDDLLAAQALLYLRYGSEENAIVQGAYALEVKKAVDVDLELTMEVEEPIAGPSGMCHQSYLCETVATMETEERTEVLVNGGVPIGSGKTIVPIDKFCNLRLKDFKFATRSLLGALFPKSVLATSSLTGKRSPAFTHLPPKQRLNPVIINDIVTEISKRYPGVTVDRISKIITTKCADEAKTVKKKKEGASSKVRERSGSSEEEEEEI